MLSRRDKLLVHPWEKRRFKDHRAKVSCALPMIDSSPPPQRPHVALKLKKAQHEDERRVRLEKENFALLQRLAAIMRTKRLDNCWTTPMPHSQNRVGLFYDQESLSCRLASSRSRVCESDHSEVRYKCYACQMKKMKTEDRKQDPFPVERLPSIAKYGLN